MHIYTGAKLKFQVRSLKESLQLTIFQQFQKTIPNFNGTVVTYND